uniref:Uncharacterized protein n=1 Tax=Parastrongyloides trichosuri TaxID=131310 RepID=A0A0N5A1X7_PARTI
MNVSPTNSGESLRSIIQKLKIIQNDCKNNGKDVKLSLCRDAEEVLKNASDIISKLEEKKNNAIVKEDVDEIKKISDKIVIIENRAIALCNLDILFQDRYTDEVIIPYDGLEKEKERIEKMDKEIKEKNEAENQKKKEQDKIKKIEMEKKIKEKKKEAMRDEYVKELNFSDNVKKNDVIVKSKVYHHLNESNKKDDENEYSNSSTSNSSEDEDSSDKKKSKSTNKTAGGDLEDDEFSKFINNVRHHFKLIIFVNIIF